MNKRIKLSIFNKLEAGLSAKNHLIQVVIGPRQVGKTTTVLDLLSSKYKGRSIYESADMVFNSSASWLVEKWHQAQLENKILVIDEIQKCENWAEVIKKLWDEGVRSKKNIKCILLGSSSLEIQKGLTESLTGRFQLIRAHHWNYQESAKAYGLAFDDFLQVGGYPASYQFKNKTEWAHFVKNSIIATVVEKDILQFQKVNSPSLFRQAFEIIVSYPAQEISLTKLLGQIQDRGNVDLVKYYLSLYEGAFLIKTLEKYSEKKIKIKASSPKIIPLAPCLYFLTVLDTYDPEEKGRVFELLVGAQLVRTEFDLFYWREGTCEVDFVLKVGKKIFAVEVKSGRKKNFKGFTVFKEKFKNSKGVLITPENYIEFEKDPVLFLEAKAI